MALGSRTSQWPTTHHPSLPFHPVLKLKRLRQSRTRHLPFCSLLILNNKSTLRRKLRTDLRAAALLFDRSLNIFEDERASLEDIIVTSVHPTESEDTENPVQHYTDWIVHCAKAKKTNEAENVFAEMISKELSPTVATYTAMMRAYQLAGKPKKVFEWYRRMRSHDITPTVITLGTLLATCAPNGDVNTAAKVLKEFRELEIFPDIAGMNTVMKTCLQSGDLELTERVFDQIDQMNLHKSIVSYNTMIDALAELGTRTHKDALKHKAFGLKGALEAEGLEGDQHTYNALMKLCLKMGDLREAQRLFAEMKQGSVQPDVISYTLLINGYADSGDGLPRDVRFRHCTDLLVEMERTGVDANAHTYNALLKVCVKIGDHIRAMKVFELMKRRGIAPDVVTYGTLIHSCVKNSPDSNPTVYLKKCFSFLKDMKQLEIKPNVEVISTLLNACADVANLRLAKKLMNYAKKEGIELNAVVYTAFMKVFLRADDVTGAERCIKEMEKQGIRPNDYTFNQLLQWYIYRGNRQEALRVFKEMQLRHIAPAAAAKKLMKEWLTVM